MEVRVESYAGYRGAESPRRFFPHGRRIEVERVEAQWQEPARRCFRVRGDDGGAYLLCQDSGTERWRLG